MLLIISLAAHDRCNTHTEMNLEFKTEFFSKWIKPVHLLVDYSTTAAMAVT
jgi:hypothetical protein